MIVPGFHAFTLFQGTTLRKPFTWIVNNIPVDLTGYSARCQLRLAYAAPPALDLTVANGGILINPTAGTITLFATDIQTAALEARKYLYDIEIVDTIGDVSRLVYGTVTVINEVTK